MHGSNVVPMIKKKLLSSLHVNIVPNHIRIDCHFLRNLLGDVTSNYGVFKEDLPYHLLGGLKIPPIVVEGEVIPFHPKWSTK